MKISKKISTLSLAVSLFSLVMVNTASAHVVVRPAEVLTAGFQTFNVSAPNEKDVAYNNIKLVIPSGLMSVSPTVKPGWQVDVEKEGTGEKATVKSITWSGNSVAPGFREDFTFSSKVSSDATDLQWKAYQTYEGGITVAWDLTAAQQPKKADGSPDFSKSGPFSLTKVVKETEATTSLKKAEQATANAKKAADRALYVGVAALILSLVGVYGATRKASTTPKNL
jgi:uncharacterized protein YcnI